MGVHKLIPYWIRVREVEEPQTRWDQTNIHANEPKFPHDNLADYFQSFIEEYLEEVHKDEENEKTFTIEEPVRREGNTIEGRIKSGEWGRNADFWDIDEHERIVDAREENHAEEISYYFLFHIPDIDSDQALLILSKYKRKGVKTLFSGLFNTNGRDIDTGDAYMTIEPHYSDEVIKKIEEADSIGRVSFRGNSTIPARDKYADRQDVERTNQDLSGQLEVSVEQTMSPKGNEDSFREFVKGLVRSNDVDDFDYGSIEQQKFDSASLTVIEGESELTFSLWKERIAMRMDLDPDEHDLDIYGGTPTPHSLGRVARQLANDLMSEDNSKLETESLIPSAVGVPDETALLNPRTA
ncbi:hypothetical protein [Haloarchaeobius iranensis]|uniref:Uncharacterized protein n=1 Tax=Haloarchaeobius iranensis TaxID=996166 RepID=A0A1G9XA27_9EURY|nr:hypothetical protein [Haloarchaeobius iranensis]SDM93588.1 hypothetical protein SAMN05192554_1102 [Haloarchaeobius iranensis]